jgi:hypothetical protein
METSLRPAAPQDAGAVADVLIESRLAFLPFAPSAHSAHSVRKWVAEQLIPTKRVGVDETSLTATALRRILREELAQHG